MTRLEVLNKVEEFAKAMGTNIEVYEYTKSEKISLTIEDFLGFNSDWSENYADYDEDIEEELIEWLETNCKNYVKGYYSEYYFNGFYISLGWTSYDI